MAKQFCNRQKLRVLSPKPNQYHHPLDQYGVPGRVEPSVGVCLGICWKVPLYPLFLWSSVPTVPLFPLFLCSHCSSGPLYPLVLCAHCSSGLTVPLVLCTHFSSGLTVPLILCTHCSSGPLYPLVHGAHCSYGPLCALFTDPLFLLFHYATNSLCPLFLWSSVPTVHWSSVPTHFTLLLHLSVNY